MLTLLVISSQRLNQAAHLPEYRRASSASSIFWIISSLCCRTSAGVLAACHSRACASRARLAQQTHYMKIRVPLGLLVPRVDAHQRDELPCTYLARTSAFSDQHLGNLLHCNMQPRRKQQTAYTAYLAAKLSATVAKAVTAPYADTIVIKTSQ